MDWPDLALVVITYNRKEVLRQTLYRLEEHLYYVGKRHLIIADDGSDDGTQDCIREEFPDAVITQSHRVGLGANANAGLRAAFSRAEYVLQLQDDMHLCGHLDLHPHVQFFQQEPTCGFLRLWGVSGHRYQGELERGYWRVWWHSPELYIPSDRPHLKHKRFHEHFGWYPEGLKTAHTEEAWCHHCKDLAGSKQTRMDVFVPHSVDTEQSWEHACWEGKRWREQGL